MEITDCLHRDILNDKRLHRVLLGYVCEKPRVTLTVQSISIFIEDITILTKARRSSLYYCQISFKGKSFRTDSISPGQRMSWRTRQFTFGLSQGRRR